MSIIQHFGSGYGLDMVQLDVDGALLNATFSEGLLS
jgi:hypothetical protein